MRRMQTHAFRGRKRLLLGRNLPRKALSNLSIKWLNDGKMWEVCGPAQKSSKIRIETNINKFGVIIACAVPLRSPVK